MQKNWKEFTILIRWITAMLKIISKMLRKPSRSDFRDTKILPGLHVFHTPVHTESGLTVMIDTSGGKAAIAGFCVIDDNFNPPIQI
jgi:hypothetical protein